MIAAIGGSLSRRWLFLEGAEVSSATAIKIIRPRSEVAH